MRDVEMKLASAITGIVCFGVPRLDLNRTELVDVVHQNQHGFACLGDFGLAD